MTSLKSFGNKVAGPSNLVERLSDCAELFRSAANSKYSCSGKKQNSLKKPKNSTRNFRLKTMFI